MSLDEHFSFKLTHSEVAFDLISISKYTSDKTGLDVVIADAEGPMVSGSFVVATEALDDDGLPHTLEHMIFLGSEKYPYKGILDLLANKCFAEGTNAYTSTDCTSYSVETVGSEGFLTLLPIYIDHILYPTLTDEAFLTEVHHITGDGKDAGVVYSEIQSFENGAESLIDTALSRLFFPDKPQLYSQVGGVMKNLRESTDNRKVKQYHHKYYRPESLKIIIVGQINHQEVFRSLQDLEDKIITTQGDRPPFKRLWQDPTSPLESSSTITLKYPADEEEDGKFTITFRGPPVKDTYSNFGLSIFLTYLTDTASAPLRKIFVDIPDPYASSITGAVVTTPESMVYLDFCSSPVGKIPKIKHELLKALRTIFEQSDIDMKRLHSVLRQTRRRLLHEIENYPSGITQPIVTALLHLDEDLAKYETILEDIENLMKEDKSYWLNLLDAYIIDKNYVAVESFPSKDEKKKLTQEEELRIKKQKERLGEEGLKEMGELLEKAVEFNNIPPPEELLSSIPVPKLKNIKFYEMVQYSNEKRDGKINPSELPIFTCFNDLKTNFIYVCAMIDISGMLQELKKYIPLFTELLIESPIQKGDTLIPYDEVVAQLNDDTVYQYCCNGHSCGGFSDLVKIELVVELSTYETGLNWLGDLLNRTVFTEERLQVLVKKIKNGLSDYKRSGCYMLHCIVDELVFDKESIIVQEGVFKQEKCLNEIMEKLAKGEGNDVIEILEKIREFLTDPNNINLYISGNLAQIDEPVERVKEFLCNNNIHCSQTRKLKGVQSSAYLKFDNDLPSACIVGINSLETSYFHQTAVLGIKSLTDPDLPAFLLYVQYLTQIEGPLYKAIRGKGYAYGFTLNFSIHKSLLYIDISPATDPVSAYKACKEVLKNQLERKNWEKTLMESARSSLVYYIIDNEKSVNDMVELSLTASLLEIDFTFNRDMLKALDKVTEEDLNRVGDKYITPLFDTASTKIAIVTDPAKIKEIATGFKELDIKLTEYASLEESFLVR